MKPQTSLTLEKNHDMPCPRKQDRIIKSSHVLQSVVLLSICAAAVYGAGYYAESFKENALHTSGSCMKQGNLPPAANPKSEEPAVGHIFWESVTRLIISAKK
jgi:hypothetical protein